MGITGITERVSTGKRRCSRPNSRTWSATAWSTARPTRRFHPRVEYRLTSLGESLMPHVDSLIGWAVEHFQKVTGGKVIVK